MINIEGNTYELTKLTPDAYRMKNGNSGGSSIVSEAVSMTYWQEKRNMTKVHIETEVEYSFANCKQVDFVGSLPKKNKILRTRSCNDLTDITVSDNILMGNYNLFDNDYTVEEDENFEGVGVSVTRAMIPSRRRSVDPFIGATEYTVEECKDLLNKKIFGLVLARNCSGGLDSFYKSYLHILCQTPHVYNIVMKTIPQMNIVEDEINFIVTYCKNPHVYDNYDNDKELLNGFFKTYFTDP